MTPRSLVVRGGGIVAMCLALLRTSTGWAEGGDFVLPPEAELVSTPAHRYAGLDNDAALAEVARRGIDFERVQDAPGVRCPIRLRGRLHGVWIHSTLPAEERATTPFEILDARLALALDDFAEILSHHDIVEVVHFTIYRPTDRDAEETAGGLARHPGGMAIDVGALKKKSGATLTVGIDWPAAIGATTCGPKARRLVTRKGRELESLVCEAADLRLFHSILTPHYNRPHHDHFHLEIRPDTRWFLVH